MRLAEVDAKAVAKRVLEGLRVTDPKGLADHIKAQRAERLQKRGLRAQEKELESEEWDADKFLSVSAQKALADVWRGIVADAPNRACISCERLYFKYQSQVAHYSRVV